MPKHEIVNMLTGEIMEFETTIDIQLLEDYNRWVVDNKLNPPTYSPQEYAIHLESEKAKVQLAKAVEMVEYYSTGNTPWGAEVVSKLLRILKDEE
jgi:hypothetical protein